MEMHDVRERFEAARQNRRLVMQLRGKADGLRLSAMGGAIRYDGDRVQTSPDNYQERWLIEAADLERRADDLIRKGDANREQLYEWMKVCTNEEFIVLTNHYINDMSYREIECECADALGYKRYNTAHDIAQRGIQKISESF